MAIELPKIVQKILLESDVDSTAAKVKAKLDELGRGFDDTGRKADDAGTKVEGAGSDIDSTGKKSDTASVSVKGLGDSAEKTGAKSEVMGKKARTAGDEVEKGGKKARTSRDDHDSLRGSLDKLVDKFQIATAATGFFQGSLSLLKIPTLISAIGPAVGLIESLGGALVAVGSAIAPVVGLTGALATGITALATVGAVAIVGTQGIGEAFKAAAKGGKEFQDALDKLSPAAADFVKNALAFKPVLEDIRKNTQEALFSGMTDSLAKLSSLLPVVNDLMEKTAGVVGQVIARLVDRVTTPQWLSDLKFLGEQNLPIVTALGEIVGNLIDTFRNVAVAASPMTQQLAQLAVNGSAFVSAAAEAGRETGRMQGFFERALGVAEQLGRIIANVVVAIVNIGSAAAPAGQGLVDSFEGATRKFRDFTGSFAGQNQLREFFEKGKEPVHELIGLFGDLVGVLHGVADTSSLTGIIKVLRADVVPVIDQVIHSVGPDFLQSIIQIGVTLAQIFGTLAGSSGSLSVFVELLGTFASVMKTLIDNIPGFSQLVGLVTVLAVAGKAFAVAGFVTGISSVTKAFSGIASASVGVPALLGGIAEKMTVLPGVTTAVSEATGALTLSLGPLGIALGLIGLLVGGILLSNFLAYQRRKEEIKRLTQEYTQAVKDENGTLLDNVSAVTAQNLATETLARALGEAGTSSTAAIAGVTGSLDAFKGVVGGLDEQIHGTTDQIVELAKQLQKTGDPTGELRDKMVALGDTRDDLERLKSTIEDNREALSKAGEAFFKTAVSTDAAAQSILLAAVASEQGAAAAGSLRAAMQDNVVTSDELKNGQFDLSKTLASAKNATQEASQTTDELTRTQARSIESTLAQLGVMTTFAGTTQDAAKAIGDAAVANGDLTTAQLNSIIALNTNKDGTIDYKGVIDDTTASVSANAQAERDRQSAINESRNAILTAGNAELASADAIDRATEANAKAAEVLGGETTPATKEQEKAVRDATRASEEAATRVAENNIKHQEAAGIIVDETTKNQLYAAALREQAQTAIPSVAAKLNELATQIEQIPPTKTTTITAETAEAERRLAVLKAIYDDLRDKKVIIETIGVDLTQTATGAQLQGAMVKMASGGRTPFGANPGFITSSPTVLVGEGSAVHPEFVIPTDPQFHERSLALYDMLGRALGAVGANATRATAASAASIQIVQTNSGAPQQNAEPSVVDNRRIRNGPALQIGEAHFHDAIDYDLLLARTEVAISAGGL